MQRNSDSLFAGCSIGRPRLGPSVRRFAIAGFVLAAAALGGWFFWKSIDADVQETVILGQTQFATGSSAALRVQVRHRGTGHPIAEARVEISLRGRGSSIPISTQLTGTDGSIPGSLSLPEVPPGEYTMLVDVASSLGKDHIERRVTLSAPTQVFLTTDKPLYQPGQTIHMRALAVNARTAKPCGGESVVFEVDDGKGNRVFRSAHTASQFGIAAAEFVLASEVNSGRYKVRAIASAATTERAVEVKPYVLPKFKVAIAPERAWYRPGQVLAGTVSARYFFGKSVAGASVEVTAETLQEEPVKLGTTRVSTDADGKAAFRLQLPDHFVGMPQKAGQAILELTARVVDAGGHAEQTTTSLSVSAEELILTVVPENGSLVPGVENLVYVLAAYPDGTPAACALSVNGRPGAADASGVAVIALVPDAALPKLSITASDAAGRRGKAELAPEAGQAAPALLVRADKPVYDVGQTVRIAVLTAGSSETVFIDVVRDRQTVLTRSVAVDRGRGELAFELPADLRGLLRVHAYTITRQGEDWGNSRLVFVRPASGLQIATRTDQGVFRPGDTARLEVTVRDVQGHPTVAALGLCAVDESVFALQENQPGLLAQFLEVEGELLKPRYQIKFFQQPARFLGAADQHPALAQAFLAAWEGAASGAESRGAVIEPYLAPGTLERIRRWRGTPEFEVLRRDPKYAAAVRVVEGWPSSLEWRESTGPGKALAAAQRRARLKVIATQALVLLVVGGGMVGIPFWCCRRGARSRTAALAQTSLDPEDRRLIQVATAQHERLAVMALAQLLWYPAALVVAELLRAGDGGTLFAAFLVESLAVGGVLFWCMTHVRQLSRSLAADGVAEARSLAHVLALYFGQFVLTRAAILDQSGMFHARGLGDWMGVWLLAALFLPALVLGWSSRRTGQILAARNVPRKGLVAIRGVDIFITAAILLVLLGMLTPSLAKAKSKAQRIMAASDLRHVDAALQMAEADRASGEVGLGGSLAPRVRRHFPETLFWQPEVITDELGRATVEIPLADSITTWRTSLDAVNAAGCLGSAEVPLRTFQDFFVDLDLPVTLTLGDEVSVPVTCYNYLARPQTVRLTLAQADWHGVAEADRVQVVALEPNDVRSVHFPLRPRRVGTHQLTLTAHGTQASDAIERELRVAPSGQLVERVENGVLRDRGEVGFDFPFDAIPDSASLVLKLFASRFSEIVEGLDTVFQAPYGCFEQTSSTTYPNILALDYLQRVGRLTPEIEIKARKHINAGYQRLLTFEVAGGGFEWFGRSPANVCLTAYGLLEFSDLARVHPIDERVIDRALAWLAAEQQADGSWAERHRGWTWAGRGPITAFVAWGLAESGHAPAALDKALAHLRAHPAELDTAYAQALAANAALARDPQDAFGRELAAKLAESACHAARGRVYWPSRGASMTYSTGPSLDVETTALVTLALLKAGNAPTTVQEALTWISSQKSPRGTWETTQATILAMRALVKATGGQPPTDGPTRVTIRLNGRQVETRDLAPANQDVLQWISLTKHLAPGANRLELHLEPQGDLAYQAVGAYWLSGPVGTVSEAVPEPLKLQVCYDRANLAVNDTLRCEVTAVNQTTQPVPMAIIDLGIPPGFDVLPDGFEALLADGHVARFEITGNQVILYLRELGVNQPLRFNYSLRARYPLRVKTPRSSVYEYYTPTRRGWTSPVALEVKP